MSGGRSRGGTAVVSWKNGGMSAHNSMRKVFLKYLSSKFIPKSSKFLSSQKKMPELKDTWETWEGHKCRSDICIIRITTLLRMDREVQGG